VNEIQIEVVEAEALQRRLEGARGVPLAGIQDPQLGGDEQLLTGDARASDGAPDRLLVAV